MSAAYGHIDTPVITLPEKAVGKLPEILRSHRPADISPRRRAAGWVLGTLGIALLGVALSPLRSAFGLPGALLCLLLGVVAVAMIGGVGPAVIATLVAALAGDYFFTPPIHSLRVGRAADAVALGVFFAVAAIVSALIAQLSRRNLQVIHARAEREALARVDTLRTSLLAAVSHDLRTPLHSIKAAATSLTSDEVSWSREQIRELSATIDAETDRLTALVDNLLDMSRLQAGALPVAIRPTDVEDVLDMALASLSTAAVGIVLEVANELPAAYADPGLLERAVANVLANAQRFSPRASTVRVQVDLADDHVQIRVIDHGPGIPSDRRGQLFKPFQRLGDRPDPGHGGLGLGLAIAKGLVEAMGGELALTDTPGGGATFVFTLRAARIQAPSRATRPIHAPPVAKRLPSRWS